MAIVPGRQWVSFVGCDRPSLSRSRTIMKINAVPVCLAATIAFVQVCASPATAQVSSDGTLSTTVNSSDSRNFVIENGDRAGGNLFHSFREFSVPTGGSAHFNNAADIQNIFARVTGGNISNIDGLIRANGSANLFLLNPAGILFGSNASLNIGGAFVGTTANSIQFGDGVEFSATQTSGTPLLTVSAPTGLQLGANAGLIQMQGEPVANFFLRPRRLFQAQSVALVGRQIDLDSASLNVLDGRVELWAVKNAEVGLDNQTRLQLPSSSPRAVWGTISLRNSSLVDTSGLDGGAIDVRGQGLTLQRGSQITSSTGAGGRGQGITVQTTEFVNLLGVSTAEHYPFAGIRTTVTGNGARAGDITVETRQLHIANSAWLQSTIVGVDPVTGIVSPVADSRTGDITVRASDVEVRGFNPFPPNFVSAITTLLNSTVGDGNVSGDITINANRVRLLSGGRISADLINPTAKFPSIGVSGNISIQADDSLDIDGISVTGYTSAVLSSIQPLNSGQGGNITIDTGRLRLTNGGTISTDVSGFGMAGNIDIRATDISVSNPVIDIFSNAISGVTVAVGENAVGQGGNITLSADRLRVFDGGQITSSTAGQGNAGSISLTVGNLNVEGISHPLSDGRRVPSTIAASSTSAFNAGSANITADRLQVNDHAVISVSGAGRGGSGDLSIQARTIELDRQAGLEAEVAGGDRGNITLNADFLSLRRGSRITTDATGQASGGNITLNTRFVVGLENSDIVAQAEQGTGGNIAIATHGLIGIAPRAELTPESDINASSQLGLNGTVNVTTPNVNPESGLVKLPEEVVDASQQIAQTCAASQASRFVATGRGGIPENPTQALGSDRTWNDIRDLSAYLGTAIAPTVNSASLTVQSPILEATGFTVNSQGQVKLVATSESSRPSNLTPATCSPPPVQ